MFNFAVPFALLFHVALSADAPAPAPLPAPVLLPGQEEFVFTMYSCPGDLKGLQELVGVMQAGRLLEIGTTTEIFDNPRNEYTRTLLDAIPGRDHSTRKAEHVRA